MNDLFTMPESNNTISKSEDTRSIIIIEDDDLLRHSIGRFLSLYEYRIELFASAEEALRTIVGNPGDIIITDFNLPGLNGLELTRIMRNKGITTPVVMISAIQGADFEQTAISLGIEAVFTKPINVEELKDTIERIM